MKKVLTALVLFTACMIQAQAYKGKGDAKGQIGTNLQDGGTGIYLSTDFGLGENISVGLTGNYLLSVRANALGEIPVFQDRIDLKARFNANLGDVFELGSKMDLYPGIDLGLKNFGGHLGFRYFLSDGFGLFTEASVPIAKYDKTVTGFGRLNNQFALNIGAAFNF
ncbi:DUF6646 family protein [Flavobacterium sp.]|uniref:DUF6646 family protein n=1 Tax=Flavobacterium sp. TaxID=239 RepID=UPI002617CB5E|nr:DUF6646 family protein [Flavobacterium sp.]MDG2431209.1 hypothetical protein [Flavobacterium sp.]